ncbi:MAG TPA: VWA domain-containing protein [Terriglobia bacterium]|nr:VWA domain-containing protein [Terriglobia bacterium]
MGIWPFMLVAAARAFSQTSPPAKDQAPALLRATTHLVQVNVIALDHRGRPVADLKASDLILTDDGVPQKISVFSLEKSKPAAGQLSPLAANVFSNRWQDHPGAPTNVTLILLDAINTTFEDQAFARNQLQKFLKLVQPNDRVAIYVLGRNLRMLHNFSNDAASLLRSLTAYQGEIPTEYKPPDPMVTSAIYDSSGGRQPAGATAEPGPNTRREMANEGLEGEYDFLVLERVEKTIASLEAISNYLARLPGRKNLVWISGGFPFTLGIDAVRVRPGQPIQTPDILWDQIERGARALNNANLAIYPINARGLEGDPTYSAARRVIDLSSRSIAIGEDEINTMQDLADRTGGRAFYNTNGISYAIQRAVNDSRVSYALAYYPTHGKWDGKFHKIRLKTTRAGIHLRYRLGYFALPEPTPTGADLKADFEAAVLSPLDATGLTLTATVSPAQGSLSINLKVDPSGITLKHQGDRWLGSLEFASEQMTSDSQELKYQPSHLVIDLDQKAYGRIKREGVSLTIVAKVRPGTDRIRLVVRDVPSGAIGSLAIPLQQPAAPPGT